MSGHYGPDAFFNSGCKCLSACIAQTIRLIKRDTFACRPWHFHWQREKMTDGMTDVWLAFFKKMKINTLDQSSSSSSRFRVSTIMAPDSIVIENLRRPAHRTSFLVNFSIRFDSIRSFSMKIRPKRWKISPMNWIRTWLSSNLSSVEVRGSCFDLIREQVLRHRRRVSSFVSFHFNDPQRRSLSDPLWLT